MALFETRVEYAKMKLAHTLKIECQILSQLDQRFWFCGGSNFWLSHRKEKLPLTHGLNYRSACDVTGLPLKNCQLCIPASSIAYFSAMHVVQVLNNDAYCLIDLVFLHDATVMECILYKRLKIHAVFYSAYVFVFPSLRHIRYANC